MAASSYSTDGFGPSPNEVADLLQKALNEKSGSRKIGTGLNVKDCVARVTGGPVVTLDPSWRASQVVLEDRVRALLIAIIAPLLTAQE